VLRAFPREPGGIDYQQPPGAPGLFAAAGQGRGLGAAGVCGGLTVAALARRN
jgi:hypothetical protein